MRIIQLAAVLFGRLPICGKAGVLVGWIAGILYSLHQSHTASAAPTTPSLVLALLLITATAWVASVVIVGIWLRRGVSAVLAPLLVNSFATTAVTILVATLVAWAPATAWIGLVSGLVVGLALCRFCTVRDPTIAEVEHVG